MVCGTLKTRPDRVQTGEFMGMSPNGGQNDTGAQSHLLWSAVRCGLLLDLLPLHGGKLA
jgi:hypothetical protein